MVRRRFKQGLKKGDEDLKTSYVMVRPIGCVMLTLSQKI